MTLIESLFGVLISSMTMGLVFFVIGEGATDFWLRWRSYEALLCLSHQPPRPTCVQGLDQEIRLGLPWLNIESLYTSHSPSHWTINILYSYPLAWWPKNQEKTLFQHKLNKRFLEQ